MNGASGKGGWFREGLGEGMRGIGKVLAWTAVIIIAALLVRWLYAEYYIATHCTEVLGTRVCQ